MKRWKESGVLRRPLDSLVAKGFAFEIVKMDSLSMDSTTVPAKKGEGSLTLTVTSASRG